MVHTRAPLGPRALLALRPEVALCSCGRGPSRPGVMGWVPGHCARSRGQFTNHRARPGCTWDGGALSPPVPSSGRPCSSQPVLGPLPVWGPAAPSPSPSHPRPAQTCPRVTCSGAEEAAAGTHQPQGSSLTVHAWAPMSGGGSPMAPKVIPSCSAGSLRSGGACPRRSMPAGRRDVAVDPPCGRGEDWEQG